MIDTITPPYESGDAGVQVMDPHTSQTQQTDPYMNRAPVPMSDNAPNVSQYQGYRPGSQPFNLAPQAQLTSGQQIAPASPSELSAVGYKAPLTLDPNDPALSPDRTILGSKTLGTIADASDTFAVEMSKLGNGMFRSLALLSGMPHAANYLGQNVNVLQDFEDKVHALHPLAENIGHQAAIGTAAILTTPIIENKIASMIGGYLGAASSDLADKGADREASSNKDMIHSLLTDDMFLGVVGGATGLISQHYLGKAASSIPVLLARKLAGRVALPAARGIEAAIEGVPPENYINTPQQQAQYHQLLNDRTMPTDEYMPGDPVGMIGNRN